MLQFQIDADRPGHRSRYIQDCAGRLAAHVKYGVSRLRLADAGSYHTYAITDVGEGTCL